jgi:hypothetical protein
MSTTALSPIRATASSHLASWLSLIFLTSPTGTLLVVGLDVMAMAQEWEVLREPPLLVVIAALNRGPPGSATSMWHTSAMKLPCESIKVCVHFV